MGQVLIQPSIERHIITKEGELDVTITLNLNINLSNNEVTINKETKKESPLEIPELETPTQLVDF